MLIAVMVVAHKANEQLRLLLTELGADDRARVFLHLDQRALEPPSWLSQIATEGRVQLVKRHAVRWGGFSIIEATRTLLATALSYEEISTFVLASGSCFPIHGIADLVERAPALTASAPFSVWEKLYDEHTGVRAEDHGAVFKRHHLDNIPINPGEGKWKRLVWNVANAINCALPYSRKPPISVYKGSQWFCVDREVAAYLLRCQTYDSFFRGTFAPDELLFQSLYIAHLRNMKLPLPQFVDQRDQVQGPHYIAYRPDTARSTTDRLLKKIDIRAMRLDDIEPARRSSCLLARKCDEQISSKLRSLPN